MAFEDYGIIEISNAGQNFLQRVPPDYKGVRSTTFGIAIV